MKFDMSIDDIPSADTPFYKTRRFFGGLAVLFLVAAGVAAYELPGISQSAPSGLPSTSESPNSKTSLIKLEIA
jgi:hypothetical protein